MVALSSARTNHLSICPTSLVGFSAFTEMYADVATLLHITDTASLMLVQACLH